MKFRFIPVLIILSLAALLRAADPQKVSLFGVGTNDAESVVFVVDHSGTMIDTFDFLRDELKKQVSALNAKQKFAALFYSEKIDEVFPKDGAHLVEASTENKRDLINLVDNIRAAGTNDALTNTAIADAMMRAIAMKPKAIYLICDGDFDPKVAEQITKLNGGLKATINTLAFIRISKDAQKALEKIANDNGGQFKHVDKTDLGK